MDPESIVICRLLNQPQNRHILFFRSLFHPLTSDLSPRIAPLDLTSITFFLLTPPINPLAPHSSTQTTFSLHTTAPLGHQDLHVCARSILARVLDTAIDIISLHMPTERKLYMERRELHDNCLKPVWLIWARERKLGEGIWAEENNTRPNLINAKYNIFTLWTVWHNLKI